MVKNGELNEIPTGVIKHGFIREIPELNASMSVFSWEM
jgi:hypothetical protein